MPSFSEDFAVSVASLDLRVFGGEEEGHSNDAKNTSPHLADGASEAVPETALYIFSSLASLFPNRFGTEKLQLASA